MWVEDGTVCRGTNFLRLDVGAGIARWFVHGACGARGRSEDMSGIVWYHDCGFGERLSPDYVPPQSSMLVAAILGWKI